MGQWGFYDDEGDLVADFAMSVEHKVLPKRLQSCYQYDQVVKVPCKELKNPDDKEKLIKKIRKDFVKQVPADSRITTFEHPKKNKCTINARTNATIKCYVDRKEFLQANVDKLGAAILAELADEDEYNPGLVAGIALYLARNWQSTPIFPANQKTVNRGYGLPSKLPPGFPEKLRELAYQASSDQLASFTNKNGWSEPEKRIQALKNQIKLFSKQK